LITAGNAATVKYEKGRDWSVEDNRMPNFTQVGGLTDQQVADVVAFLNHDPNITDVANGNELNCTLKAAKPAMD
jgi:hypothetical protein